MEKKFDKIYSRRIEKFTDRLGSFVLEDTIPFNTTCLKCKTSLPFGQWDSKEFYPITEGDTWGEKWESAWFHLAAEVPDEWRGKHIVANLDFSGEGLVHDAKGNIVQGITNGSVFALDFARDIVDISQCLNEQDQVELYVEAAANGLFGVFTEQDPPDDPQKKYGWYNATVNRIRLAIFDDSVWHLWLDFHLVRGYLLHLPEKSVRRARLLHAATKAIDTFAENRKNADSAREVLATELNKPAAPSDLKVTAIGHAHIDTAWLWPVPETIRKCARTFSSQIDLIDKYPEYIFGASQPQHYQFVKEHYPELYKKIRNAIKNDRWEVQGGMWVEADCNLISGESMVRQILHGKNFFMDEFGIDVDNLWLPDVFGYSAAIPQILQKSGIKYMLTQKISWNQVNDFPHTSFLWRGIDGSEVLTHFPPENNYNSQLNTEYLLPGMENFREKAYLDEFLSLFGVGDGGGGPKAENIEWGQRLSNMESAPRVSFGKATDFFHRLEERISELPTWSGELYLELHRGTLTTQANSKKQNRVLENRFRSIEMLTSLLPASEYPRETLDRLWKKLLMNQFHDILPGSSITRTYKINRDEYNEAHDVCDRLIADAAGSLFTADTDSMVIINTNGYNTRSCIRLPEEFQGYEILDGSTVLLSQVDDNPVALVNLKPFEIKTLHRSKKHQPAKVNIDNELVLENDLIRYIFTRDDRLVEIFDKEYSREINITGENGNLLSLYADYPNDWDAWDVDIFYENNLLETAVAHSDPVRKKGPIRQTLSFRLEIGCSKIDQTAILDAHSKMVRFETRVDWHESHRMLRVSFPVNISTDQATFDIQYGYLKRSNYRNTSWDAAKFEAPAHRYVDLSAPDYGVALLNDCKYGHKVFKNTLDLNLLRSPTYPDPDADRGSHEFTYCLLPHRGDLTESDVIPEAAVLNRPPLMLSGCKAEIAAFPVTVSGDGVSLEVIKRAEKDDFLILRIVETHGKVSAGKIHVPDGEWQLQETDLLEWKSYNVHSLVDSKEITLEPFEIRTYKLMKKDK